MSIIICIIVLLVAIALIRSVVPYIIGIGIILGIGYLIITHFGVLFAFILSKLHIIVGIFIVLCILGFIVEKYDSTIGRKKRLKLRNDVLETLSKLGMADCDKIASILMEEKDKVLEELKVLVSLGSIDAELMNQGEKKGEYIYKSLKLGSQSVHPNYEVEEINLD